MIRKIIHIDEEKCNGCGLCATACFYPYRTDKYEGWYNRPSWGVVNDELWFTLTSK